MAYTTINKSSLHMNTKLYTGNGGTQSIDVGFQSDWTWLKSRTETKNNILIDAVRGSSKDIISNSANAENTDATRITGFDSDGFNLGSSSTTNTNSQNYVSWNWKAGTSFTNDASSTGIGTIDSAGSFNNDAGFSVVTYTGTGSNGTIKHGLNSVPKIVFWKRRDNAAGAVNWIVQSPLLGNQNKLVLNTTEATSSNSSFSQTNNWTNALIDLKTYEGQNASNGTYVAYSFAEKQGYSKFGSYTGNGNANGPMIVTGMKPSFVMTKPSSATGDWYMHDNKRDGYNPVNDYLKANANDAESNDDPRIDLLSNGFKFRTNHSSQNGSGVTYIYMAFGQSIVGTNNIPATAR